MPISRHARQNLAELAKAHERLAADDGDVERLVLLEEREHRVDELLTLEVLQLAQRDLAAEMVAAVRITAGAGERALARNLYREVRLIAGKNPAPRPDDSFHCAPCRSTGDRQIAHCTRTTEPARTLCSELA